MSEYAPIQHLLNRHEDELGAVSGVPIPRLVRSMALMTLIALVAVILFLVFVPWVQTTSGAATVTALDPADRIQPINALVNGRIEAIYVREGQTVKEGDPLLKLVDIDPNLLQRLQAKQQAVEQQIAAIRRALETAEINYQRQTALAKDGLAAQREVELARIAIEEWRGRLEAATIELNVATVELSRQAGQTITAPRDGTIVRLLAGGISTLVSAGDPLAQFMPIGVELAAALLIDGRDIGLVTPGRRVRLQFEGWPVVQVSGWPSIAIGTFGGVVESVDQVATASGQFRALVVKDTEAAPWPEESFVRQGAKARGWVIMDTVPLWYELWRQLNNFPPNFVPAAEPSNAGG